MSPIAKMTNAKLGHVKGNPVRFVCGHHNRGKVPSAETRRKMSALMSGSGNPSWKGGRTRRAGRLALKVGRSHPMADSQGYCFEHRLVMAGVLGRWLTSEEIVHHIDLDPGNNIGANLAIVTRSQHARIHHMIDAGIDPVEAIQAVLLVAA